MTILLRALGNLWGLLLLAATAGTLLRFLYSIYFARLLRARRIAAIRMRRLVEEAAERDSAAGRRQL